MGLLRRRPVALTIAALIGVPLGVLLIVMGLAVAVALSGTSIDVSRWRDAAAERASAALGRPVILQGAFELEPRAAHPQVTADVRAISTCPWCA